MLDQGKVKEKMKKGATREQRKSGGEREGKKKRDEERKGKEAERCAEERPSQAQVAWLCGHQRRLRVRTEREEGSWLVD